MYYKLIEDDKKFGVPEQKKFPLYDADHVRSAIKFFNYVDTKYEKELAKAIIRRAKEYGVDLSEISIGDNNRFKKYLPNNVLEHKGIKGWTKKDHKYISRFFKNGKWFYVYKNGKKYNRIEDILGKDELDAVNDAYNILRNPNSTFAQKTEAHKKYDEALSDYLKTPIAKFDKYSSTVSDVGKEFIDKLRKKNKGG